MVPLFILNKSVLMAASILNTVVISCCKSYALVVGVIEQKGVILFELL